MTCSSLCISVVVTVWFNVDLAVICSRRTTMSLFCKCDWDAVGESLASVLWQVMNTFDEIEDMALFKYMLLLCAVT